jgi:acyl-[acyl carrier protein]--UDP-N-acetylglucosamine O-acyltransferase
MAIIKYVNGKTRTGSFAPTGGGFIENTATVDPKVYVGPMVSVIDKARVYFGSRLDGQVIIAGEAVIGDPSDASHLSTTDYDKGQSLILIDDHAVVQDKAVIKNKAHSKANPTTITGYAMVKDQAQILAGIVTDMGVVRRNALKLHHTTLDSYQSLPSTALGPNG